MVDKDLTCNNPLPPPTTLTETTESDTITTEKIHTPEAKQDTQKIY